MARATSSDAEWIGTIEQLGGAELLEREARESKAFTRPREIRCAVELLRFVFAYCLGKVGLRLTAAWAEGAGLASISNVALLGRLRNAAPWLERIAARLLVQHGAAMLPPAAGKAGQERLIRLIDATNVVKAGTFERANGGVWRIHAAFDLPAERFSAFEITDEKGAEAINRVAVVAGEIRVADRVHCRVDDLADVIARGGDVVVRAGWRGGRWRKPDGAPFDLVAALRDSATGLIDRTIALDRAGAEPLVLRLVAVRMPKDKAVKAVVEARAASKSKGNLIDPCTLVAAEWVILVTSLAKTAFSAEQVLDIYRLRWRIEIAFKRMKSLIELQSPPGQCPKVAKAWVLVHLIAVLLTEAQSAAIGDSPRRAPALRRDTGAPAAC